MAKKQSQKKRPQKQKIEWRRVFVAGLAVVMALLLLLPMISMIAGGVGAVTQSEIDALKEEQRESQVKQQELKNQLADVKEDQAAAQQRRQLLQQQLEAINAELDSINAQISYYDQEIAQKEAERREAEAKEQAQYELFCERVRAMEEEGTVSYWSILFNAEDFSDLLDRLADVDAVMDYDNQVMEELTAARQELERLQAELESARAEEQAAKDQQEAKKAEQQAKVAEAQKLLDQINADAAELNRQLDDEMEGAAEIQAEIARKQKQLEEERRQNNVTIDSETNYLWPLPGYYRLTSLFGYRIHPITGKAHSHTGIDIPAPGGTPIQACKSGQVVTSAYHYSYGNYVVIDHGNGNSTLYAHMSSRAVSEGQMVSQGQTIGYVGTTGSSTGNHLHLELFVDGALTDTRTMIPYDNTTSPDLHLTTTLDFICPLESYTAISAPFRTDDSDTPPHLGVDFAAAGGTPVQAAQSGVVTQAGWDDDHGYFVTIYHGANAAANDDGTYPANYATSYAHLQSKPAVQVGQRVAQGDVIGYVGSTGRSTGNHLHFQLLVNGTPVDPLAMLPQ